jgi:hypothetical protein
MFCKEYGSGLVCLGWKRGVLKSVEAIENEGVAAVRERVNSNGLGLHGG